MYLFQMLFNQILAQLIISMFLFQTSMLLPRRELHLKPSNLLINANYDFQSIKHLFLYLDLDFGLTLQPGSSGFLVYYPVFLVLAPET